MKNDPELNRQLQHTLVKMRLAVATRIGEIKDERNRDQILKPKKVVPTTNPGDDLANDSKPRKRFARVRQFLRRLFGRR